MHEVIRRVAEEAATDVGFDTANLDALSRTQKKLCKNNQAAKLVNGLIDRGVVKRTVMTSVYGVTYIGARQQIQEKIEEKVGRGARNICWYSVQIQPVLLTETNIDFSSSKRKDSISMKWIGKSSQLPDI